MYYIAVDLGTTSCKTALYDGRGEVAVSREDYPLYTDGARAEQDAAHWESVVKNGIKQVLKNHDGKAVKAIAVSGQSISFVPIDKSGKALHNAISWLDNRAGQELSLVKERFSDERIFELTGKKTLTAYTLSKLMWLKNNAPDIYNNTYKIVFPTDYINYILTGKIVTDYTVASGSMMFDVRRCCWSKEILRAFDLDINRLPDVKPMGAPLGNILPKIANELGLSDETEVILGGQDQKLAAMGAGLDHESATVSLGTATAVSTLAYTEGSSVFALDKNSQIYESVLPTSGAAIKWTRTALNFTGYDEMNHLAEQARGSGGVKVMPDMTKGGSIIGLSLGATRGNIVFALYEGIAAEIAGFLSGKIKRLKLFGGGAESQILCRIIAQVTGRQAEVLATNETASLGAAMLASKGKIKPAGVSKVYD